MCIGYPACGAKLFSIYFGINVIICSFDVFIIYWGTVLCVSQGFMMCRFVGCIESYSFLLSLFLFLILAYFQFIFIDYMIYSLSGRYTLLLIDTLSLLLPGQIEMVSRTKYW